MASDVASLVERLRQKALGKRNLLGDKWGEWVCEEAAVEIERLEAKLREAVEVIQFYARAHAKALAADTVFDDVAATCGSKRARAFLATMEKPHE